MARASSCPKEDTLGCIMMAKRRRSSAELALDMAKAIRQHGLFCLSTSINANVRSKRDYLCRLYRHYYEDSTPYMRRLIRAQMRSLQLLEDIGLE